MKVLIVDSVHNSAVDVFRDANIDVDILPSQTEEELCSIIGEYDAVLLRNLTFITKPVIDRAKHLKIIGRVGAGLDNLDVRYALDKGICIINSPDGNTIATSELTIGLMLSLSRHIPSACASIFMEKWERSRFMGNELFGKTLGIIGFGKIGSRVAKLAEVFGMEIVVYSRNKVEGYKYFDSLDKFLPNCDYISLHLPLTSETSGMINSKTIALMKSGVKIINCSRGGLVVEHDLVQGIEDGIISGIATDVFETEPNISCSPLLKHPDKVVALPHLGASTIEAQTNVARDIASQVVDVLNGKKPKTPVYVELKD